jgi:predicted DNA-binding transcriptional regulator YafY
VRALEQGFERPGEFELAAFWDEWSRAFEQQRPRVAVTVQSPAGREVLEFESLRDAYRALLARGAQVEVLEPAELRERVAETSRELAALYAR